MSKRCRSALAWLVAALLLAGCWDRREINDIALVVASAVDKEGDQYRLTVQIPLPSQMGSIGRSGGGGGTGGSGTTKSWYLDSAVAESVRAASEKQQAAISRQLYFSHRRVFLFGEEAARGGIEPLVDLLGRLPQNRLTAFMLVTRGPARDVLNADAPMEPFPAEMARELASATMKQPRTLKDLVHAMLTEGVDPILPAVELAWSDPGEVGKPRSVLRMSGLAVFRQNRLAGFLDPEQTKGLLWAMGQAKNSSLTVALKEADDNVSVQFPEITAMMTPELRGNRIAMQIRVKVRGRVVENESPVNWSVQDRMAELERLCRAEMKARIDQAMEVLQHRYGSDAMGFGNAIHRRYPAVWRKLAPDWERHYPQVQPVVSVEVHLEQTGTLTSPFGFPGSEVLR